jgi:hypothetical protein
MLSWCGGCGQAAIRVHGFREADQEGLYKLAHENAGHGRKGLGGAQALKKVGGARWEGTRTVLGSDSEGDTDEEPCLQVGLSLATVCVSYHTLCFTLFNISLVMLACGGGGAGESLH